MTLPALDDVMQWPGLPVHDSEGTACGTCRAVYADDDSRVPEWIEVAMPEDGIAFVPTLGASESGGVLRLGQPAATIASSPRFAPESHLSPDDEKSLYDHYGVAYSSKTSDTLLPAAADGAAGSAAPPAAAQRRLRRIEPVGTPAAAPPPRPTPAPTPAQTSSKSKAPLALAGALPLLVLAARRTGLMSLLGRRKQKQQRVRRQASAVAVLAPLAAGAAAKALQSRKKPATTQGTDTVVALPPVVVVEPTPVEAATAQALDDPVTVDAVPGDPVVVDPADPLAVDPVPPVDPLDPPSKAPY